MLFDRAFLVTNLSFIYRTMLASAGPLLDFAAAHAFGSLRDYYLSHAGEERGHDQMLRDDLLRLGVAEIDRYHGAAQLVGSQYYLVAHDHPALLLGYMAVMEGNAMPLEMVDQLEAHHKVELTCLRHHAAHDPGHFEAVKAQIARLAPELQSRVHWNARCTISFINSLQLPHGVQ